MKKRLRKIAISRDFAIKETQFRNRSLRIKQLRESSLFKESLHFAKVAAYTGLPCTLLALLAAGAALRDVVRVRLHREQEPRDVRGVAAEQLRCLRGGA